MTRRRCFREENIDVLPVSGDVTSLEDCQNLIAQTISKYGQLDILINNAGKSMHGLFTDTNLDLFKTIMDINYGGSVTMTKLALPHLIKSNGSVVFISSVAGLKGLPYAAPYSASKAALKSFHESLRAELGSRIHVGILYAGFTENDPDKVKYNAAGELVPSTREKFAATQVDVAKSSLASGARPQTPGCHDPDRQTGLFRLYGFPRPVREIHRLVRPDNWHVRR